MDFITLAEYKVAAGINSPNQDLKLQMLVDFVNDFITQYIGLSDALGTETHYLYAETSTVVLNEEYISITSITKSGVVETDLTKYSILGSILQCSTPIVGTLVFEGVPKAYIPTKSLRQAAISLINHYDNKEYLNKDTGNQQTSLDPIKTLPPHIKSILDLSRVA